MSLRDQINACCSNGRLTLLPPLIPSVSAKRHLFVSEEVLAVVRGPWPKTTEGVRHAALRQHFDRFSEGGVITVADKPRKKPRSTFMARVSPVEECVLDIRAMDPNPGIRAFGCFAEKDTFIALTYRYREELGFDDDVWNREVLRCKARWRNLFHTFPPLTGSLDDYLSDYFPV